MSVVSVFNLFFAISLLYLSLSLSLSLGLSLSLSLCFSWSLALSLCLLFLRVFDQFVTVCVVVFLASLVVLVCFCPAAVRSRRVLPAAAVAAYPATGRLRVRSVADTGAGHLALHVAAVG